MSVTAEEFRAERDSFRSAFIAAKAFIDSHVADPDITIEMCDRYSEYLEALKDANEHNGE